MRGDRPAATRGSALAAYCAAAGFECYIAILEKTPIGKVQQMLSYGAKVLRVEGDTLGGMLRLTEPGTVRFDYEEPEGD